MSDRVVGLLAALSSTLLLLSACSSDAARTDAAVDAALDSGVDVGLDAIDARGERSPWALDFGPMADVNLAACRSADAWSSGRDAAVADGGGAPKILWRRVLGNRSTTSYWAGSATSLFVNISGEEIVAISPKDGSVQWRKPAVYAGKQREVRSLQVDGADLFITQGLYRSPPPVAEAWDPQSGQGRWVLPLTGPFRPNSGIYLFSPLVAFKDGSRAVATSGWDIHRYSRGGKLLWKVKTHGTPGPMFVDGGQRLFVGLLQDSAKSRIAAYRRDGQLLWERPVPLGFAGGFPGDRDRVHVLAGSVLYAFEGSCGRQLWQVSVGGEAFWPRVDVDGSVIVLSRVGAFGQLTRVSPDGAIVYQKGLSKDYDMPLSQVGPIGANGVLYVALCTISSSPKSTLVGFDVKTGEQRFALPLDDSVSCSGRAEPMLYPDGKLYVAAGAPNLQVIAVQTNSGGLANSVWPAQGGGNRRLYATWPAHDKR